MDPCREAIVEDRLNEWEEAHKQKVLVKTTKKRETLWQQPGYKKLFTSYSISMVGQWLDLVALLVLFGYVWNADPLLLAFIPIAFALPQMLFGQFAGVFVKKYHKVKVMAVADGVTSLLTISLLFTGHPLVVLGIISLRATVNVVHYPAQQSLLRQLIRDDLRLQAITWNGAVSQAAKIIGPMGGGALLTAFSPHTLILLNGIAFLLSALLLTTLFRNVKVVEKDTSLENQSSFWASWKAGWQVVFKRKVIYFSFAIALLGMSVIQMVDIQFPVLFRQIAAAQPQMVAWIMAAIGTGAIAMMAFLGRMKKLRNVGMWLAGAMICIGIAFLGIGMLQEGFLMMIPIGLGLITGLGTGTSMVVSNYIIQTEPREQEVSQVAGIYQSLISMAILLPPLLGAWLIHLIGIILLFQIVGAVLLIIGGMALCLHPILFTTKQGTKEAGTKLLIAKE
ncbi:MFS transporter [Halalkalibacterium halodurans]|uniref:Major facilitator superfamily (MFS) profile domain-containing protein n=1 Tax=Halalkalibacterium halodurans TaxID=86665 RepID=A0A0M0KF19_ALKHA|nr:MFS transporter [Halalkalibacterium halodurans]TPE67283.1 MFS transporter [Halalkalibacterium halodurans]